MTVPKSMMITDITSVVNPGNTVPGYDTFTLYQQIKERLLYYAYDANYVLGIRFWPEADKVELLKLVFSREVGITLFSTHMQEMVEVLDRDYSDWRESSKVVFFDTKRMKCVDSKDFRLGFPRIENAYSSTIITKADKSYSPIMDKIYGVWSKKTSENTNSVILFLYKMFFKENMSLSKGKYPKGLGKALILTMIESYFKTLGYPTVTVEDGDILPELVSELKEPRDDYRYQGKTKFLDKLSSTISYGKFYSVERKEFCDINPVTKEDGMFLSDLISLGINSMTDAVKGGEFIEITVDIMQEDIESVMLTPDGIKVTQKVGSKMTFDDFRTALETDNVILVSKGREETKKIDDEESYQEYMLGLGNDKSRLGLLN